MKNARLFDAGLIVRGWRMLRMDDRGQERDTGEPPQSMLVDGTRERGGSWITPQMGDDAGQGQP